LKLVDGKKLVVYFGCFCEDEPEDDETVVTTYEEYQKIIQADRTKIIEGFMKSGEAQNVSDLYTKLPTHQLFNPIVFTMHLPFSLQKPIYAASYETSSVTEDFECVFDGDILLIAGLADIDKTPYGAFDVRDCVRTVLKKIIKVKLVPPTLHSRPISLVTKKAQVLEELDSEYFMVVKPADSKTLLRMIYDEFGSDLGAFYEVCSMSSDIDDQLEKLDNQITQLLKKMGESSATSWRQAFRKRGFAQERRKEMVEVLTQLAKCQTNYNILKRTYRDFKMIFKESSVSKLISLTDLKFYGTPTLRLDIDLVTKTVEYVRSELEGYSRNTYTLLSALTGGIIGSIITLLVRITLRV
jgi:hypothetical protein